MADDEITPDKSSRLYPGDMIISTSPNVKMEFHNIVGFVRQVSEHVGYVYFPNLDDFFYSFSPQNWTKVTDQATIDKMMPKYIKWKLTK